MTQSKIEWCDRSDWNPIRGCTRVSPGCGGPGDHGGCYAETIAARFSGPGKPFEGFARMVNGKPRWTGKVALIEDRLTEPLHWRKPARIFACSMSDLFHENLPDDAIDKVFAVMALCPQHTFQVLTKRPERMLAYFSVPTRTNKINGHIWSLLGTPRGSKIVHGGHWQCTLPLPNVWLGVSVEDQTRADERIPLLRRTPATTRFLSCEPLLGALNIRDHLVGEEIAGLVGNAVGWIPPIDWVIAGGESGRGDAPRPMHPDWVRSLRDQCQAAGVPFFFKQWGNCLPFEWDGETGGTHGGALTWELDPVFCAIDQDDLGKATRVVAHGREFARFGHKNTGAVLDGREWREFPA